MASKTEAMAEELGKGETKVSAGKPTVHAMHIHKAKGGHVVHHFHRPGRLLSGAEPDETHVVPYGPAGEGDLDNLHAHMEDHMGAPNAGEGELAEGVIPGAAPAGGASPAPANLTPAAA